MDVNQTIGMSSDFPMDTGVYHMIQNGSISIFNHEPHAQTTKHANQKGSAGLAAANGMHNFLFYNGNKNRP